MPLLSQSATGVIDARDSSVRTLTKALDGKKEHVKEFESHVPQVEERMRNASKTCQRCNALHAWILKP